MTSRRRTVLVETLRELANLSAGALVLGRFVSGQSMSLWLLLAGAGIWLLLVGMALLVAGEQDG
ncbi:MAG: hypothetical protein HY657_17350 [Acidobacteria bacterium]|nr:hypothetical protein [Acidobacteriota bacterium]